MPWRVSLFEYGTRLEGVMIKVGRTVVLLLNTPDGCQQPLEASGSHLALLLAIAGIPGVVV